MMNKLFILLAVATIASADDADDIRSVLRRFNESVRSPEPQSLKLLFTGQADYRDAARMLKGADNFLSLLAASRPLSERTPPMLVEDGIRLIGDSGAFVDAQLVQNGSLIIKRSTPVVLLFEKDAGAWKIASWRMSGCQAPLD